MKISVQTNGVTDIIGIDAGFAAIKAAGFDAVDFGLDGFFVWDDLMSGKKPDFFFDGKTFYEYIDKVKAAAEKNGLEFGQMHAPYPTYAPRSPEGTKNIREAIKMSIDAAGYLGCPQIVIHPCCDGSASYPSLTKAQEYEMNIEFFSSIIPLLKKNRVKCCLENMWKQDWKTKKIYTSCCADMREAVGYIDELNEKAGENIFGFCLDTGHLVLLGLEARDAIEMLGERLIALHIHDNNGIADEHISPYLGVINWEQFINAIRNSGYKGTINFETSEINRKFPKELLPAVLSLIASTGRYFDMRINAPKEK